MIKSSTKPEEKNAPTFKEEQEFAFPEHGIVVQAKSQAEANEKLKVQLAANQKGND